MYSINTPSHAVSKSYIQPVKGTSCLSCAKRCLVRCEGWAGLLHRLTSFQRIECWPGPNAPLLHSPSEHRAGAEELSPRCTAMENRHDCLPNPDPVPPSGALELSTEAVSHTPGWLSAAGTIGIHQSLSIVNAQAGRGRRPAAMIQSSWRREKLVGFVTLLATPPPSRSKWNVFHL